MVYAGYRQEILLDSEYFGHVPEEMEHCSLHLLPYVKNLETP